MKKLLALLIALVFVWAVGAESNFHWNLVTDFNASFFAAGLPTGERTERTINIGGIERPNYFVYNPHRYGHRGVFTYTTGFLDVFSYGSGQWLRGNELRMTVGYRGRHTEFHTMVKLDELVRVDLSDGTGRPNELGPNSSLVQTPNGNRTANWGDFLRFSFYEYFFRVNAGFITGYVGNTHDRGKVDRFDVFTDDLLRTIRVENYGVMTPDANADFLNNGQDINNFMRAPMSVARHTSVNIPPDDNEKLFGFVEIPYFMVAFNFSKIDAIGLPLTLQFALDPGNNSGVNAGLVADYRMSFNYIKFNGAVRLSGEAIADRLTFDAIYRFKGGDPNTLNDYVEGIHEGGFIQPDGLGVYSHTFGLFANILGLPNLGIGLGYSGYIRFFEEDRDTSPAIITHSGPLFSGIDLRIQYTGIPNLTITSANNVSFARINRSSLPDDRIVGVLGVPLPLGTSQSWFALYNALGFNYRLNERFTASFQIANRFGRITTVSGAYGEPLVTVTRSRMQFGGGAYLAYHFTQNILFQVGCVFRFLNDTYTNNAVGAQENINYRNASGGMFSFAIPIRMRVVFGRT